MERVTYINLGWSFVEAWERITWAWFWDLSVSYRQVLAWHDCEYMIVSGVWEVRYGREQ